MYERCAQLHSDKAVCMDKRLNTTKILVARLRPENKCFVDDGAILILKPKKLKTKKDYVGHYFLDHLDKKTKSKYGWVKIIEPITLDQFVNKYIGDTKDMDVIEHNKIMLDSIQKLNADTPVAVTYSERGIEHKRMDLTVHRVFFRQESVE